MECGPIGELMTEKGGPMPLMGELRVLIGECSCPGEPSGEPIPGPREGCSEGAAMEPRPVGELRDEEFTWVEKSARQEMARRVRTASRTWPPSAPTCLSHRQTQSECQDTSATLQELKHLWRGPVGLIAIHLTLFGIRRAQPGRALQAEGSKVYHPALHDLDFWVPQQSSWSPGPQAPLIPCTGTHSTLVGGLEEGRDQEKRRHWHSHVGGKLPGGFVKGLGVCQA